MSTGYVHTFLRCPNSHAIPLPMPSLSEAIPTEGLTSATNKTLVFVCPYCGLARAYHFGDVIQIMMADQPSLFQSHECVLVSVDVECESERCDAPKSLHTIQGIAGGSWRPKVTPKDWKFTESATCEHGHRLRFDESARLHTATRADYPF